MAVLSLHYPKSYLAQHIHIMIVILVLLLVLIVKNQLFLTLFDSGFEYFVRPLVLLAPVVFFRLVFEVVVADIWISVRDADVDSLVFEDSGDFPEHLFGVLLGVGAALYGQVVTRMESSMPLSITQSKVSFSNSFIDRTSPI